MRKFVALLLCLFVPTMAFSAEPSNSYKVKYDGGSLLGVKGGDNANLRISAKDIQVLDNKGVVLATIPAAAVTEISYGQDVHRRIGTAIGLAVISLGIGALMMFSKSKKHFVGITWADGDKKGGFAMQCDKNEYRGILAGIEGITGKKAIDSDAMTVKN
jgi:hypothetical protein